MLGYGGSSREVTLARIFGRICEMVNCICFRSSSFGSGAFTSDDFVKRREPRSKLCIHAFVLFISFYHHYQCYLLSLSPMLFP